MGRVIRTLPLWMLLAAVGCGPNTPVAGSLSEGDRKLMDDSTQRALERNRIGRRISWTDGSGRVSGSVTPTRTYESGGQLCREFQQTVTIDRETEFIDGAACREDNGVWEIVKLADPVGPGLFKKK